MRYRVCDFCVQKRRKGVLRRVTIFRTKNINTPKSPNSRMQSPTEISWSGFLGSCSLNNNPPLPLSNRSTHGFPNITLNRVTGWDDKRVSSSHSGCFCMAIDDLIFLAIVFTAEKLVKG